MVAAAIIGGAAIAATGTVAASDASASATKSASNAAIGEQQQALTQQEALAQPYNQLGQSAISQYSNLLGLNGGTSATTLSALQNTPGYQFTQQQGQTGILNAASAAGGVGGNTLQALDTYNSGLADTTYQNAVGNAQGAVGLGQASAAGVASNIGTAASNIGNITTSQGTNTANIDSSEIAGLSKIGSNSLNQSTTLAALTNQTPSTYTSQYSGQGSGGNVTSG